MKVVVVGSGIAGLIAALKLSEAHQVTLVTKSKLAESNTRYAQGGIAAAMSSDDSAAEHMADTLRAGAGLCNPAAVEVLCKEGPERIRDLIAMGVEFDREDGELARGLEAAHGKARVLHAGGDATGLTIETALVRAVRARSAAIAVLEHTFALDAVLQDGRCTGLRVAGPDGAGDADAAERILPADHVVLASGGAGQLFLHTTNPTVATGDGTALALRAGALVADTEFYQFHPTALALPGSFLISEAVRGDGAVLLDANGRRFMQAVHPDAELAPRDVVARGIAMQMAAQSGVPVTLDATELGEDFLRERFPTIDAACRARGLDWARQPIPVTPAAHYWMGGVCTDLWGRTSVPGLYAVGEVACTGVHGANRLASNSLLESLVFAWRCAEMLNREGSPGQTDPAKLAVIADAPATELNLSPDRKMPTGESFTRLQLQTLMWTHVGIQRDAAGLQEAARQLALWTVSAAEASVDGASIGGASVYEARVEARETANLLLIARVMIAAALARQESRGAHFRDDFPATEPAFQHSLVFCSSVPVEAAC